MISSAIVINCLPRSGSNIVWNIIGSSPSVLMTRKEFHAITGHGEHPVTKILMRLNALCPRLSIAHSHIVQSVNISAQQALARNTQLLRERNLSSESMQNVCFKVMGRDNHYNDLIASAFSQTKFIFLTRSPLGICDSYYRRGMTAQQAAEMYKHSLGTMRKTYQKHRGLWVSFEDLVENTETITQSIYEYLSIQRPEDELYLLKTKKFGEGNESSSREQHEKVRLSLSGINARFAVDDEDKLRERIPDEYFIAFRNIVGDLLP